MRKRKRKRKRMMNEIVVLNSNCWTLKNVWCVEHVEIDVHSGRKNVDVCWEDGKSRCFALFIVFFCRLFVLQFDRNIKQGEGLTFQLLIPFYLLQIPKLVVVLIETSPLGRRRKKKEMMVMMLKRRGGGRI